MVNPGRAGRSSRGGRGGRAGRRGRVGRAGRPSRADNVPDVSVAQSVTLEQPIGVEQADFVAGNAVPAPGVAPQVAGQNSMSAVFGLLAQLLERLPAAVPAPAPVTPQGANVSSGGVVPGVSDAVGELGVPSYLRVMEHMQRLGTKYFAGGAQPVVADEWRSRLERNFHSIRCPEEYRVDLAVHYLDGDAHTWWESVLARRGVAGLTWGEFREEFDLKYFPQEALDRLEGEFLDLSQGSKSVREYETEFNRLKRYAGRGLDDEKTQVRRFLRGMRVELRNRCIVRSYSSVAELVERAALLEDGMLQETKSQAVGSGVQKKPQSSVSSKGSKSGVDQGQKRKWQDTSKAGGAGNRCFRCGSSEHRIADCPKIDERACYHCKERGHIKPNCPKLVQQAPKSVAPPQRQAVGAPRVFTIGADTGGASSSRPITG